MSNCFSLSTMNIKNAVAFCNPSNSDINECKLLNSCKHNVNCYSYSTCTNSDFKNNLCVRQCDTTRDKECFMRKFCGKTYPILSINSSALINQK